MLGIRVLCSLTLLGVILFVMASLFSCGAESTTAPDRPDNRPKLAGTWIGTVDVLKVGKCLTGGGDSSRTGVTMFWTVDSVGGMTAVEGTSSTNVWRGQIGLDFTLDLMKRYAKPCNSATHFDSSLYVGEITTVNGKYSAILQAEEYWCPDDTCIFTVRYNIKQTDH